GPDEWSAIQVLGHLLDAEVTLAFRIRKLAAEPGGAIVAWDQEKWTDGLRHHRADARTLLAAYTALRAANLEQVRRLSPAQRAAAASTHDAAEAGFVKRVVDAINTPETARAAALLHPTSLVCPSEYEAAMSFFDPRLGAKGPVPPTFTWRMEEAPAGPPMFSDR